MTVVHHPSEAVLADYASGALADGPSLVVSAHLERCSCCRKAKTLFEAVGGEALDETPPAEMHSDALARAFERLEREAPAPPRPPQIKGLGPVSPNGLVLPASLAGRTIGRRRFGAPGMWVAEVRSNSPDGWRTYVMRAPGGAGVPTHGHAGPEYTVVLRGAYRDGDSRFGVGDFASCDESDVHELKAEVEESCLCLISSRGRMRARGILRLLQGWLGI